MNLIFFGTNHDGRHFLPLLMRENDVRIVVTDLIENDSLKKFIGRHLFRRRLTEDIARWNPNTLLLDQSRMTANRFTKIINDLDIELGVVATFGKIIPLNVIESVPRGIINVHPSMLPKYRGSNPIFWAIRNGEPSFGITVHFINENIDEGPIILQKEIPIEDRHTVIDCKKIFFKEGVKMLNTVLKMIGSGTVVSFAQDHTKATYFPRVRDENRTLDVNKQDHDTMRNIIRASLDRGGAIHWHNGEKIFVKGISAVPPRRARYVAIGDTNCPVFLLY